MLKSVWSRVELKPESDEFLHLDLMRFVSSFGVLVLHSHLFLFPAAMRATVAARTQNLALFVDLFFLISGFVIAYIYSSRIRSFADFGRFIQRRIARLFPLHLATMAVAMGITLVVLSIGAPYNSMPSFSAQCIVSTAVLVQAIVPCGGRSFNDVNWSISVEMALYLLFPLTLFITRRSVVVAWTITILAIGFFAYSSSDFGRAWFGGYLPLRGVASFAFGLGLHYSRERLARVPRSGLGLFFATLTLVTAMIKGAPIPVCLALVYLTGFFAVAADMRGKVHPAVQRLAPLGQLTYSTYMIHSMVFLVLIAGLGDKVLHLSTWPMLALLLASYAIVFMLAYLSFRWLEVPSRRWIGDLPIFAGGAKRVPFWNLAKRLRGESAPS